LTEFFSLLETLYALGPVYMIPAPHRRDVWRLGGMQSLLNTLPGWSHLSAQFPVLPIYFFVICFIFLFFVWTKFPYLVLKMSLKDIGNKKIVCLIQNNS
jgi:hypothetical protein